MIIIKSFLEKINYKILFILSSLVLLSPTIYNIVTNKSIFQLNTNFNFFYHEYNIYNLKEMFLSGIIFFIVICIISFSFYNILKYRNKYFKNFKSVLIYILFSSIIFTCIFPMTSTDIFYYLGIGRVESYYNKNPYYTSMQDIINSSDYSSDEYFQKAPTIWLDEKVVYGPLFTKICSIVTYLSGGSVKRALIIFKALNLLCHIINTILIYLITNKKKVFTIIYGLNPLILIETLSSVHNDAMMVLFILLGIYFMYKKKKVYLGVISFSLASSIKYIAVLFLPFLLIYYFKKEKISKKIIKIIPLIIVFVITFLAISFIFYHEIGFLFNVLNQQKKISLSIYLLIYYKFGSNIAFTFKCFMQIVFVIVYSILVIKDLFSSNITYRKIFYDFFLVLLFFMFGVLTTFQIWYLMWLYPLIFTCSGKNIKRILDFSMASEISMFFYFIVTENYLFQGYIIGILLIIFSILQMLK